MQKQIEAATTLPAKNQVLLLNNNLLQVSSPSLWLLCINAILSQPTQFVHDAGLFAGAVLTCFTQESFPSIYENEMAHPRVCFQLASTWCIHLLLHFADERLREESAASEAEACSRCRRCCTCDKQCRTIGL